MNTPKTLFEKIWSNHVVAQQEGAPAVLYIDLHLVHEVTSPQAFAGLRARGIGVRRTDHTVATIDHSIPSRSEGTPQSRLKFADELGRKQIEQLEANCREFGVTLYGIDSAHQGVVHIIGPELGLTQPGMTIVCGDSHTATHGAFGALAFGIGTSEVEHVLATQCLLQARPKTFEVRLEGTLPRGVGAKDVILALIAKMGIAGGTGCAIEYTGSAIRAMDMEQRMTICNMTIEGGARSGLVAPDEVTYQYLAGRTYAPRGAAWEEALARWKTLPSDEGARYDQSLTLDVSSLEPRVTFGTNPGMNLGISEAMPRPQEVADAQERQALEKAYAYTGFTPGAPILGQAVDVVFIGSCTNGRLSDLQEAASLLRGRKVNPRTQVLVVPGSQQVKIQAEAAGLHEVFLAAGAEWREPGCSMCLAMNGDQLNPGQIAISTSNRNFEGRQGKGSRTLLASPLTAAAAAIAGCVTDPRRLIDSNPSA